MFLCLFCLPACLSVICPPACLPAYQLGCLSACLLVCDLSICLPACLPVCQHVNWSACLSTCLSACRLVCLPSVCVSKTVYLCACVCVFVRQDSILRTARSLSGTLILIFPPQSFSSSVVSRRSSPRYNRVLVDWA